MASPKQAIETSQREGVLSKSQRDLRLPWFLLSWHVRMICGVVDVRTGRCGVVRAVLVSC